MIRLLAGLSLVLAAGCVPKGKYDAAIHETHELYARIDGMNNVIAQMERDLASLQSQQRSTQAALDDANRRLASKVAEAGELQQSVVEMQRALEELELRKARAEQTLQSYRDLVGRFQAMIDAGTLKVKVIEGRMVVELATDILFPAGSASLSREGRQAIQEVASVLASIPDREYQIAGHTDDVPISTERFPSNWHLGAARAIAVTQLLTEAGLEARRVSAASYAEHRPIDTNRTREGKANNRRIEIIVVPDLSTLPGYEELEALSSGEAPVSGR